MTTRSIARRVLVAATAAIGIAGMASPAIAGNTKQESPIRDWNSGEVIDGEASLRRTTNGVTAKFEIDAPAGHMMTAWFVVFNNPEECDANPGGEIKCGEADIFVNQDVAATVTRVTGHVTGSNGFNGAGHVSAGAAPVGAERLDEFFVGKTNVPVANPAAAEIHLVFEDHGPLDPELMPQEIQLAGAEPIAFSLFATP